MTKWYNNPGLFDFWNNISTQEERMFFANLLEGHEAQVRKEQVEADAKIAENWVPRSSAPCCNNIASDIRSQLIL